MQFLNKNINYQIRPSSLNNRLIFFLKYMIKKLKEFSNVTEMQRNFVNKI